MSDHSSSSPPVADSGPGLSPEELAERELREIMSSPPPSGLLDEDELALDQDAPATSLTLHTSAASVRQELVLARRKVAQFKLHPYQRDAVDEFTKESPSSRQILLFVQLCAVENQISGIKSSAPPFISSPQLLENIRSFVVAVLLSSKLSAYKKDSVPVGHVMAILTSVTRSYVPENLSSDSFAFKIVKRDVQEELTQARSRIKKAIKMSLAPIPSESDSIFDLATVIVANSQSAVTVPLCARIALLRKVYVEYPGVTYWDKVDARLLLIRTTANGEAWKVTKAFERILQTDRSTYGDTASYTLPDGATDAFQNSVDDVVAVSLQG